MTLVLWVRFVAGGDIFAGGREQFRSALAVGWMSMLAYLADPVAAERGAVERCRAAARVGDGLRGRVGLASGSRRPPTAVRSAAASARPSLIVAGALLLAISGR